jgi:hypothetical protein
MKVGILHTMYKTTLTVQKKYGNEGDNRNNSHTQCTETDPPFFYFARPVHLT